MFTTSITVFLGIHSQLTIKFARRGGRADISNKFCQTPRTRRTHVHRRTHTPLFTARRPQAPLRPLSPPFPFHIPWRLSTWNPHQTSYPYLPRPLHQPSLHSELSQERKLYGPICFIECMQASLSFEYMIKCHLDRPIDTGVVFIIKMSAIKDSHSIFSSIPFWNSLSVYYPIINHRYRSRKNFPSPLPKTSCFTFKRV